MELRNEIFAHVFDWLRANGKVRDQSDLAFKTKINKNTITNIMKGITSVSDRTLLKLNEGFDYMFNMQYLRGLDPTHMLVDDLRNEPTDNAPYINALQKEVGKEMPTKDKVLDTNTQKLLSGIENLLEISARQIKENEDLRRRLQSSIDELNGILSQLKGIHSPKPYYESKQNFLSANEPINEK